MNWQAIAQNDLRKAIHERGAWALFAGFFVGFGGLAALLVQLGYPEFEGYIDLLAPGVGLLVPLAGIILGYEAIIGERESGTAVLSLSMPHSRAGLIVGKLVGRTTLLATVIAAAAFLASIILLYFFPSFSPSRFVGFIAMSIVYGTTFLWIAAGLSMTLSTSRRVIAAAFGAYIGLTLFWTVLIDLTQTVLFRFRPTSGEPETWVTLASFVGPNTSFNYVLAEVLDAGTVPAAVVNSSANFVTPAVALLALVGWAILPVLGGFLSFRQDDL
jgi:ABC-2 type transport system permease protein